MVAEFERKEQAEKYNGKIVSTPSGFTFPVQYPKFPCCGAHLTDSHYDFRVRAHASAVEFASDKKSALLAALSGRILSVSTKMTNSMYWENTYEHFWSSFDFLGITFCIRTFPMTRHLVDFLLESIEGADLDPLDIIAEVYGSFMAIFLEEIKFGHQWNEAYRYLSWDDYVVRLIGAQIDLYGFLMDFGMRFKEHCFDRCAYNPTHFEFLKQQRLQKTAKTVFKSQTCPSNEWAHCFSALGSSFMDRQRFSFKCYPVSLTSWGSFAGRTYPKCAAEKFKLHAIQIGDLEDPFYASTATLNLYGPQDLPMLDFWDRMEKQGLLDNESEEQENTKWFEEWVDKREGRQPKGKRQREEEEVY